MSLTSTSPEAVDHDDTRAVLLAAAAEVFAERGYDGARVAEIARRAGLTTGAIYSRYTGKAQLLLDAIEHYTPAEIQELITGPTDGQAPDQFLAALGTGLVANRNVDRGLIIEVFAAARREPEVAASLRELFRADDERLADLVRAGQAAGVFDHDLPVDAVVRFCTALGLGMRMAASLGLPQPDGDDWALVIERVITAASPVDPPSIDPPTTQQGSP